MELRINGETKSFEAPLSVAALLEALGLPGEGIAVERNREIVKRESYSETWLEDGDELEIVTLVGGG